MSTKFVGFVGLECYDVMLYTAKILSAFKHRVLLVDASEGQPLAAVLPEGYNAEDGVSYKGFEIVSKRQFDLRSFSDYDYVYVYVGWAVGCPVLQDCEEVYCFTDYQKHNYRRLKALKLDNRTSRFLVIKDEVPVAYVDDVIDVLGHLNFQEDNVYGLAVSAADTMAMLRCQHDGTINFSGVSKDMQQLIKVVLEYDVEPKVIAKNWKTLSSN